MDMLKRLTGTRVITGVIDGKKVSLAGLANEKCRPHRRA